MMARQTELYRTLVLLEETLWRAETRGDRALMDATFADDFFEFGRSGRVWTQDEMLFDGCPREGRWRLRFHQGTPFQLVDSP
jgi:hypothetical protein